jgi:hypothetical protein
MKSNMWLFLMLLCALAWPSVSSAQVSKQTPSGAGAPAAANNNWEEKYKKLENENNALESEYNALKYSIINTLDDLEKVLDKPFREDFTVLNANGLTSRLAGYTRDAVNLIEKFKAHSDDVETE